MKRQILFSFPTAAALECGGLLFGRTFSHLGEVDGIRAGTQRLKYTSIKASDSIN